MTQANTQHGPALFGFLLFSAVCTGALVMVVEVLGSRVIGPFFGVSLFVWTALITVTLLALALGYAVGGHIADRHPDPAGLYLIIMAAGVLVALVPWLKPWVLKATLPLGLRGGAFVSALLLFGPALFLLGCVSPYVVRIAVREWGRLGRTVGIFYAVSTAGSCAGTLATGYFVIAYLGVAKAFFLCGLLLVLLGAVYFAVFGRRRALALLPLLVLPLFPRAELPSVTTADGTKVTLVHSEDSFYGNIRVVDYEGGGLRTRELIIDGLVQGGVDLADGRSVYEYSYLMEILPLALNPAGRRCLVIGLGAGVVPRWYGARGIVTDVVDIDPRIVAVAREHFGFRPSGDVFVEDARAFLGRPGANYDFIVIDVFNGDTTPGHLLSVEAMRLARSRLNDGGVLALNLMGSLRQHGAMTASVIRTLRAAFPEVAVHPLFDAAAGDGTGNFVVIARDGPVSVPEARPEAVHPLAEAGVRHGLAGAVAVPDHADAIVLTDDFNPIDVRDIWLKERVRRTILETTPADILLLGRGGEPAAARRRNV
jgi:spermidine synthase